MKVTLKNIAIIVLTSIVLHALILSKILKSHSPNSANVTLKAQIVNIQDPSQKNFTIGKSKCNAYQNFYTPKEIKDIFKFRDFKKCNPVGKDNITITDGIFKVECSNKQQPQYGIDSKPIETYGGSLKSIPKWIDYSPPIDNKQFLFIRCSKYARYAFVFNHFKEKAAIAAEEKEKILGNNKEKMSVLLLVHDSISKYSFERNLPLTVNFLQKLDRNEEFKRYFSVYQFNKSAIPQLSTRHNMAQILYGKSAEEIAEELGEDTKLFEKNKESYIKYQKQNAIWSHFSSLGFVTMFSHSGVFDFISILTGSYIQADHVFTNFWRSLWGVTGIEPFFDGQKCFGGKNVHDYLFNYTYQFFENYPNNNKFAYVHSDAAHENGGNVKTIDEDLLRFLKSYLKLVKSRNETLAMFLMSDHGNKELKGSPQWDIRAFFEFHTPFTYLIATKNIIRSQNYQENLKHNEDQLISRYDINLSLKHLAYFPYNTSLNSWYPKAKDFYTYNNTISLFEEKVSTDRTCPDIGVSKERCLCKWYEPIDKNEFEDLVYEEMIKILTQYLNKTEEQTKICVAQDQINISNFILNWKIDNLVKLYKVEIKTKQNSKIVVEFNLCMEKKLIIQGSSLVFFKKPHSYFKFDEEVYFLQLNKVNSPSKCNFDFCDC